MCITKYSSSMVYYNSKRIMLRDGCLVKANWCIGKFYVYHLLIFNFPFIIYTQSMGTVLNNLKKCQSNKISELFLYFVISINVLTNSFLFCLTFSTLKWCRTYISPSRPPLTPPFTLSPILSTSIPNLLNDLPYAHRKTYLHLTSKARNVTTKCMMLTEIT